MAGKGVHSPFPGGRSIVGSAPAVVLALRRLHHCSLVRSDAHFRQISLKRGCTVRTGDGADIAVWADQNPFAGRKGIGVLEMAALIHDIAVRADDMNTQPGPGGKSSVVRFVAKQCPVRSLEQRKEASRLACRRPRWPDADAGSLHSPGLSTGAGVARGPGAARAARP